METVSTKFAISDALDSKGCKHCAALFIVKIGSDLAAKVDDPSATVTFVSFRGRTFAITCKHVVDSLRLRAGPKPDEPSHLFVVDVKQRHVVLDRFVSPKSDWLMPDPDIAIREINPGLPPYIGKIALVLDDTTAPSLRDVKFAVAVGFPDRAKHSVTDGIGQRVAMPCVRVVAENISHQGPSFSLFSNLTSTPDVRDLSGMSGGPIFWTDEDRYGLLGITYECAPPALFNGSNAVHITGHLADLPTIVRWTSQVPQLA